MWRLSPGIAWLAGAVCVAIGLALAGCLAFPTRPLAGRVVLSRRRRGRARGGGGRPPRGEPRGALRRPRAAAVRSRRAVSPARIRRSHEGRRARGRRRGVDGRDPPLAHPLQPGRALSHDRRRAAVRRRGLPAAPHRGRPAQRGARTARAGRGAAPEGPPGAASPAGVAAPQRAPVRAGRGRGHRARGGAGARAPAAVAGLPVPVRPVAAVLRHARLGDGLLCSIYVLLAISLAVLFGDGSALPLGRRAPRPGHRPDAGGRAFAVAAHRAGGGRPPRPGRARTVRATPRPDGMRSSSGGASASARPSSSSCWTTPTAR